LTTITNTAGALVRTKGGSADTAVSEVASAAVLPNPLETKSTVTLADQPSRTKVATITETRSAGGNTVYGNLDDINGVLPAFTTSLTRTNH
jgi:hypothetical protein